MPDWTRSMQQTYEFHTVDPGTWGEVKRLDNVRSATITWDSEDETLGSASIECDDDLSDTYLRIYLKTIQDGFTERFCLGTFLCQTPSVSFDGKVKKSTLDGYTPLIELKEKTMPIGYAIAAGENILERAISYTEESLRAPVVWDADDTELMCDFVSDLEDTRLSYLSDLLANDDRYFDLDEYCRILFAPYQDINAMQPLWTYTDDNSSILYPDIDISRDLYGVPNVVEVIYSPSDGFPFSSRAINDDKNSMVSTVARGREIIYRETNPDVAAGITQEQLDEYAQNLLKEMSSIEYKLSYTHGYCPVRLNDCVMLNYSRAGLRNIKAKVVQQSITCEPGCPVRETAVFTKQLWG